MASGIRPCEAPDSSSYLRPREKKALQEFRTRLENAIVNNDIQLLIKPPPSKTRVACELDSSKEDLREVSLWNVPLLPSRGDEGTDVILLKFLRAREFKVSEAFAMLQKTLRWWREFGVLLDHILEEEEEEELAGRLSELDDAARVNGHPVCYNYNTYGALLFADKDLYLKAAAFGSKERRERFLRWRMQFMEKAIRRLTFKPGGAGSLLQIIDLKDSYCTPDVKELRTTANKVLLLLQDNYPEFVVHNVVRVLHACHRVS